MSNQARIKKGLVFGIMALFLVLSIVPSTGSLHTGKHARFSGDESTITLSIEIPAITFGQISIPKGDFATIDILNEGYTTIIGEARLPRIYRMVEIPQGATPEIIATATPGETTSLAELGLPSQIYPVQPSVVKLSDRKESASFVINTDSYTQNVLLPTEVAQITETGEIRGHRFALIEIAPLQYNPATGTLITYSQIDLRINLPGADNEQTAMLQERYASSAFDDLLRNTLVNYNQYDEGSLDDPRDPLGYLMIVYDQFYEEIQPLVTWKQSHGYTVTVTRTSQIPGGVTTTNIKNYITTAYDQWSPPPSYVLLVGDSGQIPTYTGTQTGTCTDLYYVTITVPDYFPDLYISRFPAATEQHVINMVDKTLYYEQGSFDSNDWIKKAAFLASNDNYPVSEGTHNYVINTYLNPHGYTCDKLYCHTYGATTQQVINALNNGRSLAIYSGHGGTTSWSDGPPFSQSNVNSLTNLHMYPFVCSHACLTNQFTVSECFGETWLRAPNKAGLAFWGATTYSYWDEDDILEKRMFSAWWDENLETIGGMTDRAKILLYNYYGGGGMTKYYFEAYNVLGDSSVKIWRDNPVSVDPNQSFVTLTNTNMPGLLTCPAGDAAAYEYIQITVKNTQGNPMPGLLPSEFAFTLSPTLGTDYYGTLTCTFTPVDIATNGNGEIRFSIKGDTSIVGNISIRVRVEGVPLNDVDTLPCKSWDCYCDGLAALGDFVVFGQDYGTTHYRSDFSWDGMVAMADFVVFGQHYGHRHL